MTYSVKEIFYSLQGEGAWSGRPAVFCRFAGCNLWSGREMHRARAVCSFCDTDFVGVDGLNGGKLTTAPVVAAAIAACWPSGHPYSRPWVVCTGGEPLLQLDLPLIHALHRQGFAVAVETNGTLPAPLGVDWICVSPKANARLCLTRGDELKLVYPQSSPEAQPERFIHLPFQHFFLQPLDNEERQAHTRAALAYCLAHPPWRLSLQMHKQLGIA